MSKVIIKNGRASIYCPGCKENHELNFGEDKRPKWSFNGDVNNPTFSPSLLIRSGHYAVEANPEKYKDFSGDCWCNFKERFGEEPGFSCFICHSFITDGKIQFLDDCTHHLKGQTVPLEDVIEEHE